MSGKLDLKQCHDCGSQGTYLEGLKAELHVCPHGVQCNDDGRPRCPDCCTIKDRLKEKRWAGKITKLRDPETRLQEQRLKIRKKREELRAKRQCWSCSAKLIRTDGLYCQSCASDRAREQRDRHARNKLRPR